MASISFYLDNRFNNPDGTSVLKIRISHEGRSKYISLDILLRPEEWNRSTQTLTPKHRQFRKLNIWLTEISEISRDVLTEFRIKPTYEILTVDDYYNEFHRRLFGRSGTSARTTFADHLKKFASLKKENTRRLYLFTLSRMRDYQSDIDNYYFEDITKEWLIKFNNHLSETSNSQNYRNIHLRNIRAVFNSAREEELTTCYPFKSLKIKATKTRKRSLSLDKLREFFNYPVEEYAQEYKDMFKLMFLLCGINSVDLFHLKSIEGGRIEYNRAKTNKSYSIKVEPEAAAIIEKWKGKNFLLDVLDRYKDYRDYAHRMNVALKRIGTVERKGLGGKKIIKPAFPDLSTYWARHTWATIAAELDIPDATISMALGHTPENETTDIYIKRNLKKVDDANRKVINYVLYGIDYRQSSSIAQKTPLMMLDFPSFVNTHVNDSQRYLFPLIR